MSELYKFLLKMMKTHLQVSDQLLCHQESHVTSAMGHLGERESDKNRYKCIEECQKPVSEQRRSTQCTSYNRWFRSRGGLEVHQCRPGA